MKKITIYIISAFVTLNVFAGKDISGNNPAVFSANKTNVGSCNPSTTQVDLDINNIRARLLGGGDFWWDGVNNAKYQYPKIDQTTGELEKNVIFAGALWFTGIDDGSNLRCAAQTYRNQGHDFWTGPLEIGGAIPDQVCSDFDHHFVVYGKEIAQFIADFESNGGSISESDIPDDIKYWPGKGNPLLLSHPTFNKWYFNNGSLAPFFDKNSDGIYNPLNGDYPVIKVAVNSGTGFEEGYYADQMIFWVINDNGNSHGRTNGTELGVQVNCLAFAFQTSDELNDMTFYTYEIFKKTAGSISQTYMGVFVDPDLGGQADDFIGCDTVRSLGYCYNADNNDEIYNAGPPIMAIDYFEGPLDDDGNELGMSSFVYFNNCGSGPQCDPDDAAGFRNFQIGNWGNGVPITCGGTGFGGTIPTKYCYPGNPAVSTGSSAASCTNWSECSASNTPGDRRFLQNSGPFKLSSAQSQRISIGVMVVGTDASTYGGCPDIEAELGIADNKAQFLFDNNFGIVDGPDAPTLKIREMSNQLAISLVNLTGSNNIGENYLIEAAGASSTDADTAYTFEGYVLYQLKDNKVTAKDLSDPAKAKIVLQSDIKNGVSNVFNYVFDQTSGMYVPQTKVLGNNTGVQRSVLITDDLFADGESGLVNYKTYYFAAIAYAYNNYRQFDPLDPLGNTAQLDQYLQGRRNYNVYTAIPHKVESEVGGTTLNAEYGQGVVVTRKEGQGNGGKIVELTQTSIDEILSSNFMDFIQYEPLFDPIGFKIIDPLKVQDVDFELVIKNDASTVIDENAYWDLIVKDKNGAVKETIRSVRNIDKPYEQIIEEYGILINVGKPLPINTNLANGNSVYDYLTSSIAYKDESKRWLKFVADGSNGGDLSPSNWIRSGTFENTGYLKQIFDAHQYDELSGSANTTFYDADNIFTKMVNGGFAPYCLTANYRKDFTVKEDPTLPSNLTTSPKYVYGPAFVWDVYSTPANDSVKNPINTLDQLASVNVVLTSDKTLWSKCIVFETGEDEVANVGNAKKGQIRKQAAIDINGVASTVDTGYSYFPGYAINVETGERLNIAFGESSDRVDNNGNDMIWNPTTKLYDNLTDIPVTDDRVPVFGGKHFIYVFKTKYDECKDMHDVLLNPANFNNPSIPTAVEDIYKDIMYTSIPAMAEGFTLKSLAEGLIPNDVTIKIRVETPYNPFETAGTFEVGTNNTFPRYQFSTIGLAPSFNQGTVAKSALDNIRVVPNPYFAYSSYEVSPNSGVVKITNLPDVCTVSIFTMDGKLVKRFNRAVGNGGNSASTRQDLSQGQVVGVSNLDNSIDWNLKNAKDISVASGTYMIYVNAPGVGEAVVKSVVFIRPPDVTNF